MWEFAGDGFSGMFWLENVCWLRGVFKEGMGDVSGWIDV